MSKQFSLFKNKIQSDVIDFDINKNMQAIAILSKKTLQENSFYMVNLHKIEKEGIIQFRDVEDPDVILLKQPIGIRFIQNDTKFLSLITHDNLIKIYEVDQLYPRSYQQINPFIYGVVFDFFWLTKTTFAITTTDCQLNIYHCDFQQDNSCNKLKSVCLKQINQTDILSYSHAYFLSYNHISITIQDLQNSRLISYLKCDFQINDQNLIIKNLRKKKPVNYDEKFDHEESLINYSLNDNFYSDQQKFANKFIIENDFFIIINNQQLEFFDLIQKQLSFIKFRDDLIEIIKISQYKYLLRLPREFYFIEVWQNNQKEFEIEIYAKIAGFNCISNKVISYQENVLFLINAFDNFYRLLIN